MDSTQPFQYNPTPLYGGENYFFTPKYLNVEYIFNKIYVFFQKIFLRLSGRKAGVDFDIDADGNLIKLASSGGGDGAWSGGFNYEALLGDLNTLLYVLIVILLAIIIYSIIRIFEIRKKEGEYWESEIAKYKMRRLEEQEKMASGAPSQNDKWVRVINNISSQNENDWRQAVIDADNMLYDLMDRMGFRGQSLGDKLKNVKKDEFRNLPFAWEAHAVRNKIAHEIGFVLSPAEAKRVIALYEQIFRDYDII